MIEYDEYEYGWRHGIWPRARQGGATNGKFKRKNGRKDERLQEGF